MRVTVECIRRRSRDELCTLAQQVIKGEVILGDDDLSILRSFGLILQLIEIEPEAVPLIGALIAPPAHEGFDVGFDVCLDVDFVHADDWPLLCDEIKNLGRAMA
ncbi:hypothetical protein [Saccharothrix sp. HUAS TT1]|uniref:hypothetical protein n=1 Tax=unclassified Saccharothrix TaxID=2593673 RepID=UPI00345BD265